MDSIINIVLQQQQQQQRTYVLGTRYQGRWYRLRTCECGCCTYRACTTTLGNGYRGIEENMPGEPYFFCNTAKQTMSTLPRQRIKVPGTQH